MILSILQSDEEYDADNKYSLAFNASKNRDNFLKT